MAFNIRGGSTFIPDGSITTAKLADNSVSAPKIQTDAVTETKLATDSVSTVKLQTNAVSTVKIQNDAVSTDKVTADIGTQHFFGFEGILTHTGTTETSVAEFNFTKSSTPTESWKSLGYAITAYSDVITNTVTVKVYIDTVLFTTDGTASITPFFLEEAGVDISALANGNHFVEVKLTNSEVGGIATISKTDIFLGKKTV